MSDWTKRTEELVNTWNETQKKLWDNWLGAVEAVSTGNATETFGAERRKMVETWEASVHKGLEAQAEWARLWAEGLGKSKDTPKPMLEWAKQLQEMMKSWTTSQQQLSQAWFDMMRTLDSGEVQALWENRGKELAEAWQEAVDKALEAQRDMSRLWAKSAERS